MISSSINKFSLAILSTIFLVSCNTKESFVQSAPNNDSQNVIKQSSVGTPSLPKPDHVVIVMLENHAATNIVGATTAPYLNSLTKTGALFVQSYGLTHPSQPNYLLLFSGSNQGVTDDNVPINLPFTVPNLGASLIKKGLTFTGYSESLPSVGFDGPTSHSYARKHSPWINWQGSGNNGISPNFNQPFSSFPKDYNKLPNVSFVIPNLADDMHDGTISASDTWVKNNLDSYIQWANKNNSLLIITFDEDDKSHNNQITTVFTGQMVKQGNYNEKITHYNILRTLEDIYGLPYAGMSSNNTPITDCWTTSLTR
ncbi:MAG: acid phosphatase [Candidatus Sericytochromatia bacterium]|nr:acid phosphatase [Candidatus Sericytochromatia bacterium]